MPADKVEVGAGLGTLIAGASGLLASVLDGGAVAEWIERVGLPVALLLGLVYLLVRGMRYLASTVIEPVTARHMQFVARVEQAVQEGAAAQSRTASLVADLKHEAAEDRKVTRAGFDKIRSAILNGHAMNGRDPRSGSVAEEDDGAHD